MRVVVVVPTYNERNNVETLVRGLFAAAADTSHNVHVLVVDDNSPDGTGEAVAALQREWRQLHLLRGEKRGLGVAYARGLRYALDELGAEVCVQMDADMSHDPRDLPRLLAKIDEGYDMVVGTRYIAGGAFPDDWGFRRRLVSRVANLGSRLIAGIGALRDVTNGYRAYRAPVLRRIDLSQTPRGYAVLTFLAYGALLAGARIAEVPVVFSNRAAGTSKLRAGDAIEFFLNAWWIRYDRRERFYRYATGGLSGVAANLAIFGLLFYSTNLPGIAASAVAIEASIVYSYGWRRVWARALGRRSGGRVLDLARRHTIAVPSFVLTLTTFALLKRAGLEPLLAQAAGIIPAMLWNYFVGDRALDLLRRLHLLDTPDAPPALNERTANGR